MAKLAGPTPAYAQKLNEWNDKEVQKANITAEQLILQDEIAAAMELRMGEVKTVSYLSIAYEVQAMSRVNDAGQDIVSCMIKSKPIHEEI